MQHVPAEKEKQNSILINEHALNREPVPFTDTGRQDIFKSLLQRY